jgi:hypothetical protein
MAPDWATISAPPNPASERSTMSSQADPAKPLSSAITVKMAKPET